MQIPSNDLHPLIPLSKELVLANAQSTKDVPPVVAHLLLADTSVMVGMLLALRHIEWAQACIAEMERKDTYGAVESGKRIADKYVQQRPIQDQDVKGEK